VMGDTNYYYLDCSLALGLAFLFLRRNVMVVILFAIDGLARIWVYLRVVYFTNYYLPYAHVFGRI
jgi:hypothetical protein